MKHGKENDFSLNISYLIYIYLCKQLLKENLLFKILYELILYIQMCKISELLSKFITLLFLTISSLTMGLFLYIYIYIYIYAHTHTHKSTHVSLSLSLSIYIYIYIYTHNAPPPKKKYTHVYISIVC